MHNKDGTFKPWVCLLISVGEVSCSYLFICYVPLPFLPCGTGTWNMFVSLIPHILPAPHSAWCSKLGRSRELTPGTERSQSRPLLEYASYTCFLRAIRLNFEEINKKRNYIIKLLTWDAKICLNVPIQRLSWPGSDGCCEFFRLSGRVLGLGKKLQNMTKQPNPPPQQPFFICLFYLNVSLFS